MGSVLRTLRDVGVAAYRHALARAAAAFHGNPACRLRLVGITGTLGKTSTSMLLEAALAAAGVRVGGIGSLGVRIGPPRRDADARASRLTTPHAPALHATLRELARAGVGTAVLEVTTHSIHQERVAGLKLACGVFTNLVEGEHLEYHPSVEHYIQTKLRFVEMLAPDAPLVVGATNQRVLKRAASRPVVTLALDASPDAAVAVRAVRHDLNGTSFVLQIRRELPGAGGGVVSPVELPLDVQLLGHHQIGNAAFAGTAALLLGAPPEALIRAFAELPPIRRRLEVIWRSGPLVVDDMTVVPEGLQSSLDSMRCMAGGGLRIVFHIRGSRGPAINRGLGKTLGRFAAEFSRSAPLMLVVTAGSGTVRGYNKVLDDERAAVLGELESAGVPFTYEPTLDAAVRRALRGCRPEELVLLLGATMEPAARLVRAILSDQVSR